MGSRSRRSLTTSLEVFHFENRIRAVQTGRLEFPPQKGRTNAHSCHAGLRDGNSKRFGLGPPYAIPRDKPALQTTYPTAGKIATRAGEVEDHCETMQAQRNFESRKRALFQSRGTIQGAIGSEYFSKTPSLRCNEESQGDQ